MKIIVLTTQTLHHSWYIRELIKHYPKTETIIETTFAAPSFDIFHKFEEKRDKFEEVQFFSNKPVTLPELCPTAHFENINDPKVLIKINAIKPDFLIVFGTRKLEASLISKYKGKIINLHGGDPELYRGLDSHLWSIYHEDFDSLVTTLHILNENLDDGEIIQKVSLNIKTLSCLSELRTLNTQACVNLTLGAIKTYELLGKFLTQKQRIKGRYYSFMPAELKEVCVKKFKKHVDRR